MTIWLGLESQFISGDMIFSFGRGLPGPHTYEFGFITDISEKGRGLF